MSKTNKEKTFKVTIRMTGDQFDADALASVLPEILEHFDPPVELGEVEEIDTTEETKPSLDQVIDLMGKRLAQKLAGNILYDSQMVNQYVELLRIQKQQAPDAKLESAKYTALKRYLRLALKYWTDQACAAPDDKMTLVLRIINSEVDALEKDPDLSLRRYVAPDDLHEDIEKWWSVTKNGKAEG